MTDALTNFDPTKWIPDGADSERHWITESRHLLTRIVRAVQAKGGGMGDVVAWLRDNPTEFFPEGINKRERDSTIATAQAAVFLKWLN